MKYRNFRKIARLFEVLAWVLGLGIFVLGLLTGVTGGGANILVGILMGIVGGFLTFVFLYAFAQFIYVFLDIERNTRATVKALYEEVEKEDGGEKVANVEAGEGE